MERNKNTTDDYDNIEGSGNQFTDVNFPISDALFWHDAGEVGRDMDQMDGFLHWMRVSDPEFPASTFWGPTHDSESSVTVEDINQGYIGNCWIMAAVSAVAEKPHRIDKFMVSNEKSEEGIYAMNIYSVGIPFSMIIDD